MPLASDGKGNFLTLGPDGQWTPAQRAKNPETGAELLLDGAEWKPVPVAPADQPWAIGSALRGVARGATFGLADEMKAGVQSALGNGSYDENLQRNRAALEADTRTNPIASAAGQLYGGVGGSMAGGAAAGAAGGARLLGMVPNALAPMVGGIASGALGGAAAGFGEGQGGFVNRAGEAGSGALVGGAVGGGVGLAGQALGRVVAPVRPTLTPEQSALRQTARAEGIPLSIGEETNSRTLRNLEARLEQLPLSSGLAADFRTDQGKAFTGAALRRAGVQGDVATDPVLGAARQRIGGEIGAIAGRNSLDLAGQPQIVQRLQALEDQTRLMPPSASGPVRAWLEHIHSTVDPATGTIPGLAYRMSDSALGKAAKNTSDGDLRAALTDLRQTLRTGMDASISPQDAAAWQQARRHYANLNVIADATSGAGAAGAEGVVSPVGLRAALNRSVGREGAKWGAGDLRGLADIGQSVLRRPPDSGTGGANYMNALLTGGLPAGGAASGAMVGGPIGAGVGAIASFALPPAVQTFINSPMGRRWLTNQLAPGYRPGTNAAAAAAGGAVERNRILND